MASKDMHQLCRKIKPEDSMLAQSRLQAVSLSSYQTGFNYLHSSTLLLSRRGKYLKEH
jgi:hypothetical protein